MITTQGASIISKEKMTSVFRLTFDQYLEMIDEERMQIDIKAWDENHAWIERELEDRNAEWILVIADEIVEWSDSLDNYPTDEKLEKLGKLYNLVPWVFVRLPLIEESSNAITGRSFWSALRRNDYYPTGRKAEKHSSSSCQKQLTILTMVGTLVLH